MAKTLVEAGLAEYEPYAGVALTSQGRRLAALVLRRHRLVELFLVRVMGFGWDEVHDQAEQLEHVVSDRLIERMDTMLGHPAEDPHGDPIPNADGAVAPQPQDTLLTCPLGQLVSITRVLDQNRAFLQFVETNQLKPGETVQVEDRNESADSVLVTGVGARRLTIGARAASKLRVRIAGEPTSTISQTRQQNA
jgi:DtxR family Mn-dependent transcriptional regulator